MSEEAKIAAVAAMGRAFRDYYKADYGCECPDGNKVRVEVREGEERLWVYLSAPTPVREETE